MRRTINKWKHPLLVFLHDVAMVPVAWFLAYLMHNDFVFIHAHFFQAISIFPLLFPIQIFFYVYFGLYRGVWRYASTQDLARIIEAVGMSCISLVFLLLMFDKFHAISRMIFPLYGIILILLLGGVRLFYRYCTDLRHLSKGKSKRVLIIGAGSAGEMLVRDLLRSIQQHHCKPIAFLDDANKKQGKEIHGIRVIGRTKDLPKIIKQRNIEFIMIAIPTAKAGEMKRIVDLCRQVNIPFQTLPSLSELTSGKVSVSSLRKVAVEDLLGREQVDINWTEIGCNITGNSILVSGGGGSIGSELCRQIANLKPVILAVIEISEFNLYKLQQELIKKHTDLRFVMYLGSVTDSALMQKVIEKIRPSVIFHAAAYKHVPILENQLYSAVNNNVIGTKILAEAAIQGRVEKFIFISTDKAVNPKNALGMTKRAGEIICQDYNGKSKTQFITVRFGNVLGSSGSVVPLFEKQLADGGPLTVTHPEVTRFFMTIPEACCLILQACVLGKGGEIFVLDMGKPVKISYLAEQVIRLSGKEPHKDIKIVYPGLRPGEKLHEELFYKVENITKTTHKKIFQAKSKKIYSGIIEELKNLEQFINNCNDEQLVKVLQQFVAGDNSYKKNWMKISYIE